MNVRKCILEIYHILEGLKKTTKVHRIVDIDDSKKGMIIGPRGLKIRALCDMHNVLSRVDENNTLWVIGTQPDVDSFIASVHSIVKDSDEKARRIWSITIDDSLMAVLYSKRFDQIVALFKKYNVRGRLNKMSNSLYAHGDE